LINHLKILNTYAQSVRAALPVTDSASPAVVLTSSSSVPTAVTTSASSQSEQSLPTPASSPSQRPLVVDTKTVSSTTTTSDVSPGAFALNLPLTTSGLSDTNSNSSTPTPLSATQRTPTLTMTNNNIESSLANVLGERFMNQYDWTVHQLEQTSVQLHASLDLLRARVNPSLPYHYFSQLISFVILSSGCVACCTVTTIE
jgi:hypothetical protein